MGGLGQIRKRLGAQRIIRRASNFTTFAGLYRDSQRHKKTDSEGVSSHGFFGVWIAMNYLYSLYDALVSISVPADKARAVVDAMEREMGTTLATKQDMSFLATRVDLCATKQDLLLLRQEMTGIRTELKQEIGSRYTLLDQKIDAMRGDMVRDLAVLDLRITVKLGSMLFVGFGLTIAAMRLWV